MERSIYGLALHEKLEIEEGYTYCMRVPGGFIYTIKRLATVQSIYVPFDNEFMGTLPKPIPTKPSSGV